MSSSKKGYAPAPSDGDAETDSLYGNGKVQGGKAVEGKSAAQRRWRNMLALMFAADVAANAGLYQTTHDFKGSWSFPEDGIGWSDDTLDLFALSIFRVISLSILCPLTLSVGIDHVPAGKLPHEQSDAQLARGERTGKVRPVMLILMFLLGAVSSVYSGIKVIMFEFDTLPVDETAMAPFLLISIAVVNLQYTAIKRLVQSYLLRGN